MSATGNTSPGAGAESSAAALNKKRPQRRTLQSGFSLLSRGEPKIWVTGGMLVICLAMIISLLSLIVVNGLATFWPRSIDWLVLKDGQLDIGEPQQVVYPEASDRQEGTEADRDGPSRFYRTANFDVTSRHYRWFEADELDASGIVQPDWALVIERLTWGRMFALPSRLSLPIESQEDATALSEMLDTHGLMEELAAELQAANQADIENSATWSTLTATLRQHIAEVRSRNLKTSAARRLQEKGTAVVVQEGGSKDWQPIADQAELDALATVAAARTVWDQPDEILSRIAPIVEDLDANRRAVVRNMRQISQLDRRLSDARVAVRQAELDTGRAVMNEADKIGPLVERLFQLRRIESRIQRSAARASAEFANADTARQWQDVAATYQQTSLASAIDAANKELETWRNQFVDSPTQIKNALSDFEIAWQEVLENKVPLEQRIADLDAASEGFELSVTVPTNARKLELSLVDSDALKNGQLTSAVNESLTALGIVPLENSLRAEQLSGSVALVSFDDAAHGRQWLWHHGPDARDDKTNVAANASTEATAMWLLPPQQTIKCSEIVRIFPANRLTLVGKLHVYASRWSEFLFDDPREANTEGGVFPAIWGTVVMTLIMTLAVVPFGVIAALYLREYTRSGPLVSLIRISINNLAGVPSIVYGVFGLAFFCYAIGAFIDGGPKNADFGVLPSATWTILLAVTVAIGVGAFMFSLLSSGPDHSTSLLRRWLARIAPWLWLLSLIGVGVLVFKSPFFDGFYEARLPTPAFGKEGLLWAALTLSLLTLPVVIVATEEALAAVPNSLREGSLACGASKWQTIYRIVLPHARPGILTGAILAMARGIGEVAPLMLVGALPVAPDLPLDTEFPYFHGSRNFMHLGYQIYWLGFQSQNSEASKPLVFTCTLLLILIVVALNLSAILLRTRLRRRFLGNQF